MLKDNPSRVPLGRIRNPLPSSLTLLYTAFLYFSRIAFTISGMQVPYLCTMLNLTLLRFPFPFYVTSNRKIGTFTYTYCLGAGCYKAKKTPLSYTCWEKRKVWHCLHRTLSEKWGQVYRSFARFWNHPFDNRKQNPALYLCGEPSTYKTFSIKTFFDRLVGIHFVEIISRQNKRLYTGNLRKHDGQPYILVIDDMRWEGVGMHLPDFLNLLDGYLVVQARSIRWVKGHYCYHF